MAVIVYRKYSFKAPAPITSGQFLYLKNQIIGNADFGIDRDFKTTFISQYKKNMIWFVVGLVVSLGALGLYHVFFDFVRGRFGWPEYLVAILVVAGGGTALFMLLQMFLEGPSMATYLTERRLYFVRMKYAIRHYSDYPSFYISFYEDEKKDPFREEALQEQKQSPVSMDHVLTRLFHWIDQHFWKLVVAAIAIVLIRKYIVR